MAQSRGRSVTAVVLLVIGTLLLPVGVIGHWAYRTFTDNDRWVATVAPLTENPEIQTGIADTVTDSLITSDDAAAQVEEWFPKAPAGLVSTVSEGVVTAVNAAVTKLVATDQFSALWAGANSDVQKAAMALLNNEPPPSLSVQDGDLVLNLDVVRQNVRTQMETKGINLPEINAQAVPPTVTLMNDTQIQTVRQYYSWLAPLLQWFILLPIALLLISVFVYPNKPKALRRIGYGVLIAAGLLAIFLLTGSALLTPGLEGTAFAPAQSAIWDTITAFLAQATWVTAGVGVLLMIAGWLWGRGRNKEETPVEVVEVVEVVED